MGIKDDYQQAIKLAQQKEFKQAKKLLEPYKDHSKVRPLYDKIIENMAENKPKKKHSKLVLLTLLVIVLIALSGFYYVNVHIPAQGQRDTFRYTSYISRICIHEDLSCDTSAIVRRYRDEIARCEALHGEAMFGNTGIWLICLENQFVDIE